MTVYLLTDSVKPGTRSLPHGSKTLVLGLTAAHCYFDRGRCERPVSEPRQRRDDPSSRHLLRGRPRWRRLRDRKSVDVKMVLVSTVYNRTYVSNADKSNALRGTARHEVGASVNQLYTHFVPLLVSTLFKTHF